MTSHTGKKLTGENATPWTQPPLSVPNSPHTVPKGSLSPQTASPALENEDKSHVTFVQLDILLVDPFHIRREYACFHICAASHKQDILWMPIKREHSWSHWLSNMLRDIPIIFRFWTEKRVFQNSRKCIKMRRIFTNRNIQWQSVWNLSLQQTYPHGDSIEQRLPLD